MALNTPKRVKLFDPIVQSPGSEHNADWHDSFDDEPNVNKTNSIVTNSSDATTINSSGNNGLFSGNGSLSPVSSCDSPEFSLRNNNSNTSSNMSTNSHNTPSLADARENRRGRPRSEALTTLMIEGSTSPSSIKCRYCNRVFPREKSLQAHLRTHTGQWGFWFRFLCFCKLLFHHFDRVTIDLHLHEINIKILKWMPSAQSTKFVFWKRRKNLVWISSVSIWI